MAIALAAGLNYVGVVCHKIVEDLGIVADVPAVTEALERAPRRGERPIPGKPAFTLMV